MTFFPGYTDHGTEHVARVLGKVVDLIPADVWTAELLQPEDAAVLIGACLLHDLALHLHEGGFAELVADSPTSRWSMPLPWFDEQQGDRPADRPWSALWVDFQREARHFGQTQLEQILGSRSGGVPPIAQHGDLPDSGRWSKDDRLLVGEFLRRHHARLSHEIALYGFPGANAKVFPSLAETMVDTPDIPDAIGVTARSHGESLRDICDYLDDQHHGTERQAGALLPYAMGLLRIADYLQLDADRGPTLLLKLKDPQSPLSVREWQKHQAVARIDSLKSDPSTVHIQVTPGIGLRTHLAMTELIVGLQQELDTTGAVLSEAYARPPYSALRLTYQRVKSNLLEPSLLKRLSYVPRRAALSSSEDLFRLVVADLYGNDRAIAARELLQNALDAVRERRRLELSGEAHPPAERRVLDADVSVFIQQTGEEDFVLRVTDNGVGMTPETVIDYFLTAGASLGPSDAEREGLDTADVVRTMKTGRFGIGAFAAFLLGSRMDVESRHVDADRGIRFTVDRDEDLVEIQWVPGLSIGTEITVPFQLVGGEQRRVGQLVSAVRSFYMLADPVVSYEFQGFDGVSERFFGAVRAALPRSPAAQGWRELPTPDFDAVYWHRGRVSGEPRGGIPSSGSLALDGMWIADRAPFSVSPYEWSSTGSAEGVVFAPPALAVFDSGHRLGVQIQRNRLVERRLPFEPGLLTAVAKDYVAYAIANGLREHSYPLGGIRLHVVEQADGWFPATPLLVAALAPAGMLAAWRSPGPDLRRREISIEASMLPSSICEARSTMVRARKRDSGFDRDDNATWWEKYLCADASTVLAGDSPFAPNRWRRLSTDDEDDDSTVVTRGADEPRFAALIDFARETARAQSARICLTLFHGFDVPESTAADDVLGQTWMRIVGGVMPHDPVAREALIGDDELRVSVDDWKQALAVPVTP